MHVAICTLSVLSNEQVSRKESWAEAAVRVGETHPSSGLPGMRLHSEKVVGGQKASKGREQSRRDRGHRERQHLGRLQPGGTCLFQQGNADTAHRPRPRSASPLCAKWAQIPEPDGAETLRRIQTQDTSPKPTSRLCLERARLTPHYQPEARGAFVRGQSARDLQERHHLQKESQGAAVPTPRHSQPWKLHKCRLGTGRMGDPAPIEPDRSARTCFLLSLPFSLSLSLSSFSISLFLSASLSLCLSLGLSLPVYVFPCLSFHLSLSASPSTPTCFFLLTFTETSVTHTRYKKKRKESQFH